MGQIRNIGSVLFLAACLQALPSPSIAGEHLGNWVSNPRSAITIIVEESGGRIVGPEWEYKFPASASDSPLISRQDVGLYSAEVVRRGLEITPIPG